MLYCGCEWPAGCRHGFSSTDFGDVQPPDRQDDAQRAKGSGGSIIAIEF